MNRFIKMMPDAPEWDDLMARFHDETILLMCIARRTGIKKSRVSGLEVGEALIGDFESVGMTLQRYRSAKANLERWGFITTRATNKGTVAKLADSTMFEVHTFGSNNHPTSNQQATNNPGNKQPTIQVTNNSASDQQALPILNSILLEDLNKNENKETNIYAVENATSGHFKNRENATTNKEERIKNKEINIKEAKASCSELLTDSKLESKSEVVISEPAVFEIPLNDSSTHRVTKSEIDQNQELYPAVNVEQEYRKIIGWCNSHPQRRKTHRGVKAFINLWLSKAQDSAGMNQRGAPQAQYTRPVYRTQAQRNQEASEQIQSTGPGLMDLIGLGSGPKVINPREEVVNGN